MSDIQENPDGLVEDKEMNTGFVPILLHDRRSSQEMVCCCNSNEFQWKSHNHLKHPHIKK